MTTKKLPPAGESGRRPRVLDPYGFNSGELGVSFAIGPEHMTAAGKAGAWTPPADLRARRPDAAMLIGDIDAAAPAPEPADSDRAEARSDVRDDATESDTGDTESDDIESRSEDVSPGTGARDVLGVNHPAVHEHRRVNSVCDISRAELEQRTRPRWVSYGGHQQGNVGSALHDWDPYAN